MNEWREVKLGGLVSIGSSKRIFYKEYVDEGIPFYRSKEVIEKNKRNVVSTELYISQNRYQEIKDKFGAPKKGDILLTSVGTLGVPWLIDDNSPFYFKDGNLTWLSNFSEHLLNTFLYYWIVSPTGKESLDMISIGSTQAAITIRGLKSIDILLPPLPEQKAIAEVLSSLDDKIDLLHRQNKTLEQMAETLFRQWFVEEAEEDWEEVVITDLFEIRDGTHDSPKQKPFGKSLITSKHIKKYHLDFGSAYLISEEDFIKVNQRSLVNQFDILFSMIGTIGLIYIESNENIDYAIKNVGLFKTSQNKQWVYFTYLWLNSSLGEKFIFESKSGSTQQYISLGSLRNIKFNIPHDVNINSFNTEVKPFFYKIFSNQTQIRTLESLRDTLLPKLMSGEVRIASNG